MKSGPESYRGVCLAKDRSEEETELRSGIKDHTTIRWVIQNGTNNFGL